MVFKNAGNVSSAIDSIYGENSIASLFGVAGANIPNSGNERIKIGENIKREDLAAITKYLQIKLAKKIGTILRMVHTPEHISLKWVSLLKKQEEIKRPRCKYDDIIEELQKVQTNAQNEGRDITEIENIIGQFANAKNIGLMTNIKTN